MAAQYTPAQRCPPIALKLHIYRFDIHELFQHTRGARLADLSRTQILYMCSSNAVGGRCAAMYGDASSVSSTAVVHVNYSSALKIPLPTSTSSLKDHSHNIMNHFGAQRLRSPIAINPKPAPYLVRHHIKTITDLRRCWRGH